MIEQDKDISFHDKNQKFWQLGLMLSSGFGPIASMTGAQIAKIYGIGIAMPSILLGNFILWFIGFAIISMTQKRAHVIQNIEDYLGRFAAGVGIIILAAAFIIWYALQIKIPAQVPIGLIEKFIKLDGLSELKVGAALGAFCALLSIGGIRIIKWINVASFPILAASLAIMLFYIGHVSLFSVPWTISFTGIFSIVLTWLPGTVNLSTFFRHSRSKSDSILGLTLMMICHIAFQCCFILLDISNPMEILMKNEISNNVICIVSIILFVFFSFLCVNLLNIYWASIGLEVFFKSRQEAKGYTIIGLLGTVIYVFLQSSTIIFTLENLGTSFITNLGIVFVVGYLIRLVILHRTRRFDTRYNAFCWFIGCGASLAYLAIHPQNVTETILTGINASLLSFAVMIFLEEIHWSLKKFRDHA